MDDHLKNGKQTIQPKRRRGAMELIKMEMDTEKSAQIHIQLKCMFARTSPSSSRLNIKPTHFDVIKVNRIDKSRFSPFYSFSRLICIE